MQTHLRRLHGFETFGEVDGTLLQLVRDPGELVAMDGGLAGGLLLVRDPEEVDGGLAGGVVGGHEAAA